MAIITKYWDDISGDELVITTTANSIVFESDPNETYETRQLNLTVKLVGFDVSKQITIKQEAKTQDLIVLGFGDTALSISANTFLTADIESIGSWPLEDDEGSEPEPPEELPGTRYFGGFTQGSKMTLYDQNDVLIEGLEFGSNSPRHVIELYNCNRVTIRNCYFHDSHVIYTLLYQCTDVLIEDCMFENIVCGAYIHFCTNVVVRHNDVLNLQQNEEWVGNFVFLNECDGVGNYIGYNAIENIENESYCNDLINIYMTSGTQASPFIIEHNWTRGGGPHGTSGGLMAPDVDGEYIIVRNNILVNPGQYGIAASAGRHVLFEDNILVAEPKAHNNVGIYATNFYPTEFDAYDITIRNNQINYLGAQSQAADMWLDEANVGTVIGKETNIIDRNLDGSVLPAKILRRLTVD